MANALEWVASQKLTLFLYDFGIKYVLHYLDNFLLAESLESGEGVKSISNPTSIPRELVHLLLIQPPD